jgi:hypothetical protein
MLVFLRKIYFAAVLPFLLKKKKTSGQKGKNVLLPGSWSHPFQTKALK